jgi:hypothetical protein
MGERTKRRRMEKGSGKRKGRIILKRIQRSTVQRSFFVLSSEEESNGYVVFNEISTYQLGIVC